MKSRPSFNREEIEIESKLVETSGDYAVYRHVLMGDLLRSIDACDVKSFYSTLKEMKEVTNKDEIELIEKRMGEKKIQVC